MKKNGLIFLSMILILILSTVAYFYIWGGKPQIENFEEVSYDYETVAKIALNYYNEHSPKEEYIVINVNYYDLECDDTVLQLTESQKESVSETGKRFGYLRVSKDAVFFCVDETGYYGLVYSENPLSALYKEELPQRGREYHRINGRWYEWGV